MGAGKPGLDKVPSGLSHTEAVAAGSSLTNSTNITVPRPGTVTATLAAAALAVVHTGQGQPLQTGRLQLDQLRGARGHLLDPGRATEVDRDVPGPVGALDRAEPERYDDSHIAGLSRIPLTTIAQDATTLAGSALGLAPGAYRGRRTRRPRWWFLLGSSSEGLGPTP